MMREADMSEPSTKPYLIRAIYEWCTDSGLTPYVAVSVDDNTHVPREYVRNGEIVLNVSALATSKLQLGNEFIEFQARFGGVARQISVPVANVTAVYAKESGHGMAFEVTPRPPESEAAVDAPIAALPAPEGNRLAKAPGSDIKLVHEQAPGSEDPPPAPGDGPRGKPRLKIVK